MKEALGVIDELKERYASVVVQDKGRRYNTDLLEAVELGFLLDIAEVVVVTARNREESRGGHMRDDYPTRDDEKYMKHTMAYLSGDAGSSHSDDHIRLDWKPVVFTKNEAGELRYPPLERKY
jgi:succinate dehydrogenase / fumarate reductase flavoprotein subunit